MPTTFPQTFARAAWIVAVCALNARALGAQAPDSMSPSPRADGIRYSCPSSELGKRKWATQVTNDAFQGARIERSHKLAHNAFSVGGAHTTLQLAQSSRGGAPPDYSLTITWEGREWWFLEPGKSLVMLVDGTPTPLTTDERPYRDVRDRGVFELVRYTIDSATIRRVAEASEVKFRGYGGKQTRDFDFGRDTQCAFGGFANAVFTK